LLSLTAGRRLLAAFYRPEYAEHVKVLVWLAVAASLNYTTTFLNAGVTATREFSVLTRPYILLAVLALGLSASLISCAGLLGAAWACCGISAAGCAIPIMILARMHTAAKRTAENRAAAGARRVPGSRIVAEPDRV
jgi:O-antigen/teichoic acid export membrane protein